MISPPRAWKSPTDDELAVDPELAALALLEAAIVVAVHALEAANPELNPKAQTWSSPPAVAVAAREIVVHGKHVLGLIEEYRLHLEVPSRGFAGTDDDIF